MEIIFLLAEKFAIGPDRYASACDRKQNGTDTAGGCVQSNQTSKESANDGTDNANYQSCADVPAAKLHNDRSDITCNQANHE